MKRCDYLIIGAGIVGLTIAREIKLRSPTAKIVLLEKEPRLGVHASGRNSGVLHTGIYYPPGTLKARFCKEGADALFAYAIERDIPVRKDGKLIVATSEENAKGLDKLLANAKISGICAVKVGKEEMREVEPHACAEFGGIYCKDTAVIDSPKVLESLWNELGSQGVQIEFNQTLASIDEEKCEARTQNNIYNFGFFINAAGAQADSVAKLAKVGLHYKLIPFKGTYYKLAPEYAHRVRASIYPVPDPELPFLGIHFTRVISGDVYIGPTAIPALGRENYGLIQGIRLLELPDIFFQLSKLYLKDTQNFRNLVHSEIPHYTRSGFIKSARRLVDILEPEWMEKTPKVGIRPQLLNTRESRLEMDFLIERGTKSLHVLNSISPAFTSSFAVAKHIVDQINPQ